MVSIQLRQPEPFNFKDILGPSGNVASSVSRTAGLSAESEAQQINSLLYCLGEEANEVLSSTNISEEERKLFSKVIDTLDEYFKVRRNIIFERARFNHR